MGGWVGGVWGGGRETLSWQMANYQLQPCSTASIISIVPDIKDDWPLTTQQEKLDNSMAWNFKSQKSGQSFLKKPLIQPQQFGLKARTARWDSLAQILQEDMDITAAGRKAAKSLPCKPILLHRYASKEEQTNYNHSIPSNRVLLSFKLRKLLSVLFERIEAQCSPASTVWAHAWPLRR